MKRILVILIILGTWAMLGPRESVSVSFSKIPCKPGPNSIELA